MEGFFDPSGNNYLRPYNAGMTQHEATIATIILLSEQKKTADVAFDDYLTSFKVAVKLPELSDNAELTIPNLRLDGSHDYYGVFNNFSLTSVTEAKNQMAKIHMNFGSSWNAFFFGEKPTLYGFSGFFLDSEEYPYYQEFMVAYDKYLNGRKCVENGYQMYITYDGKIISGYLLDITTSMNGENPFMKSFQFTVLVRNENWFRINKILEKGKRAESGLNILGNKRIITTSTSPLI